MIILSALFACPHDARAAAYEITRTNVSSAGQQAPSPTIVGVHPTIVTPAKGQGLQQQQQDQYDCFLSAKQRTGFDPATLALNPPPPRSQAELQVGEQLQAFRDAQKNCLVDRGYDVKTY